MNVAQKYSGADRWPVGLHVTSNVEAGQTTYRLNKGKKVERERTEGT